MKLPSWFGLALASFACLMAGYESVGIADGNGGVPTISRLVQGLRDSGSVGKAVVWVITVGIVAGSARFLAWLIPHFTKEKRSSL